MFCSSFWSSFWPLASRGHALRRAPAGAVDGAVLAIAVDLLVDAREGLLRQVLCHVDPSGKAIAHGEDAAGVALQPTEWQSIPRVLQQNLKAASANFAYRLVEPAFQLPLKLDRHEAAKLLPARVNNITLKSVIADSGAMLTVAASVLAHCSVLASPSLIDSGLALKVAWG